MRHFEWLQKWRARLISEVYADWLVPKSKVLDIGCGDMVVTDELRKKFDLDITGADVLDYGVRDLPFKLIESKHLPFLDKAFDFAILNSTLHHSEEPKQLLNEAQRVARVILIIETKPTLMHRIFDYVMNSIFIHKMHKAVSFKRLEEWVSFFKDCGYSLDFRTIKFVFTHYAFRMSK